MIFISQPLIDWALKEEIVTDDKVVKIYSGIELDQFRPVTEERKNSIRSTWGIGHEDVVVGVVSKLWEGKGHAVLIRAFEELRKEVQDIKLVIVGEGYLDNELRDLVRMLGLNDSVLFTGFQMDVSEIIATFDVAVLPSFFEGMGRVLLEAMAMEKPVVASRVGGIPDLVEHGVNGFLVNPGDVLGLSNAIRKIVRDKKLADEIAKKGRKRITEQFSADAMVKSIEKVYNECLNAKGITRGS
jgi:glycosyltransferase involved in cell wall biosynthesis